MPDQTLHLVKVPLRADRMVAIAKRRGIRVRDLDDGYLVHCLLSELWQERAPTPFVLRGNGRAVDIWGYSPGDAATLIAHAKAFGDPSLLDALAGVDQITSREMPCLAAGRSVGFVVRVCPVVRLVRTTNGHRAGAEVDAFLGKCFSAPNDAPPSREVVYRDWFAHRLRDPAAVGATLTRVRVAGMTRARVVRRTQGNVREARSLERPDVSLEGELVIQDGVAFLRTLARGVGRHCAFGFGALMVVPSGTSHTRA
jgi:CRISPR system Cascade subunit CasE